MSRLWLTGDCGSKRHVIVGALAVACLSGVTEARAATRINGNQLLSGARAYGELSARKSAESMAVRQATPQGLVLTFGQAIMARGSRMDRSREASQAVSPREIGLGLSFDIAHVVYDAFGSAATACNVSLTGDVNVSGTITSADVIGVVNYVFKSGTPPLPCTASGDVNCNAAVTSADVIALVNYVFKGGPAPCDVCSLIPGMWSCP